MSLKNQYAKVCEHVRETAVLRSTLAVLEWDQQTKLPQHANAYRTRQITTLSGLVHQRATDPLLGSWLEELEGSVDATAEADVAITVKELKKQYDRLTKLPARLVEDLAAAASEGQAIWVDARNKNDFDRLIPHFKKIFDLKRKQAVAVGYEDEPYDALLEEYEPGAKAAEVAEVLDKLSKELVPLVNVLTKSDGPDDSILKRQFPSAQQEQLGRNVAGAIGFDFNRGRLDVTHHPFCTELGPHDCRICTRYNENFFSSAIFGTLHEAGHGIYEQGLPKDQYGLPLGSYCSLGIHESQSRLWENLVGRSHAFWEHFYPEAQTLFPESLGSVSLEQFFGAINKVQLSMIRVEADEATYNLHIIIRFKLERSIINGDLRVEDLADAWNQMYEEYLGSAPPSDVEGVMQDVHWPVGLVGYFPTYSLGNVYASMLFEAAESKLGDLPEMFAIGEFQPLKEWLNSEIHQQGRRDSGPELCLRVTGKTLDHSALLRHLKSKYSQIYTDAGF